MAKENLLDLGRTPTLDELRAFFQKNDWSGAAEIDYDHADPEELETLEYLKDLVSEAFEPLAREMGLKSDNNYYGRDNPLMSIQETVENHAAAGVMDLLNEKPDLAVDILGHFFTESALENPEQFQKNVDDMFHNAIKMTMQTMNYEEVAQIINETPAYEDFNHSKQNNYRAKDFDRKWNHTRTKIVTESIEEMKEKAFENSNHPEEIMQDTRVNVQEEVVAKLTGETFWSSISDKDKHLLQMRMDGLSQKEIAEKLGYKTHSAVTKRLEKLKEEFIKNLT